MGTARAALGRWSVGSTSALGLGVTWATQRPDGPAVAAAAAPEVRDFEPHAALTSAGADGLADLRAIVASAPRYLAPGGLLALETGIAHHAALLPLAAVIVSLIDIDLHEKIIPDVLNLSVFALGAAALFLNAFAAAAPADAVSQHLPEALGGAVVYGGLSFALRGAFNILKRRETMGLGDVKFFAAAGFWLGLDPLAGAAFLVAAGLMGVVFALVWKKAAGEAEFPFGPALAAALVLVLLCARPGFLQI